MHRRWLPLLLVAAFALSATPALAAPNSVSVTPSSGPNAPLSAYVVEYQNSNGTYSGMHGLVFDSNGDVQVVASSDTFCVMPDPSTPCSKNLSSDWAVSSLAPGTWTVAVVRYGGGSDQSSTVNSHCSTTAACSAFFAANYYTATLTLSSSIPPVVSAAGISDLIASTSVTTAKGAIVPIVLPGFAFAVLVGLFWLGWRYFRRMTGMGRR